MSSPGTSFYVMAGNNVGSVTGTDVDVEGGFDVGQIVASGDVSVSTNGVLTGIIAGGTSATPTPKAESPALVSPQGASIRAGGDINGIDGIIALRIITGTIEAGGDISSITAGDSITPEIAADGDIGAISTQHYVEYLDMFEGLAQDISGTIEAGCSGANTYGLWKHRAGPPTFPTAGGPLAES